MRPSLHRLASARMALGLAVLGVGQRAAIAQTPTSPTGGVDLGAPSAPVPPPSPPAPEAAPPPSTAGDLVTFEGLADAYISAPLFGPMRSASELRGFEPANGTFSIAYLELAAAVKPQPAGMRIDLGFGPVAGATSVAGDGAGEAVRHIQQAYGSFRLASHPQVTLDVGKFVTAAGAEVIEAKANWNYSRSFLFLYAIPFTHTGARLSLGGPRGLTLQVSAVNGWDVVADNNDGKTFGVSASFAAPSATTVTATGYAGPEGTDDDAWRWLADLVVTQEIGSRVAVAVNADYGREGRARWWGAQAMARVLLSDRIALALRGEHFADPQGARHGMRVSVSVPMLPPPGIEVPFGPLSVSEVTATLAVRVGTRGELRGEVRTDVAARHVFQAYQRTEQVTFQAAALAWF